MSLVADNTGTRVDDTGVDDTGFNGTGTRSRMS